jgi:hypothetical protein
MPRISRPVLIGAIGAVVAGVAVALGLMLASIEDTDVKRPVAARGGNGATTATPIPPSTATPAPTRVPATATPANARNQQNRGQSPLDRLEELGRDAQGLGREAANAVSNAAIFGTITSVNKDRITIKTVTGSSFTTEITNKTEITSGIKKLKANDLKKGDSVFILSMDGGDTAFSISSFGALATIP